MSTRKEHRVRTEEQLARKRHADRLNHKARRERDKNRDHRIELELESLRSQLHALRAEFQTLKSVADAPLINKGASTIRRSTSPLLARYVESVEIVESNGDIMRQRDDSPLVPRTEVLQILAANYSPAAISDAVRSAAPASQCPLFVFCVCGIEHKNTSECVEYASYRILLRAQVTLLNGTAAFNCLPRTPDVSHLLLQSTDDNPVVTAMATVFKGFEIPTIPVLFGLYILMYRLLRWRLCPYPESYEDIPPWYRPSTLQETVPHIISADYLPWPLLRDYVVSKNLLLAGSAHSVLMYTQSIRFAWPEGKELVIKSAGRGITLNPEFESHVMSLENWKISRSWVDRFPDLVHLVNVEDAPDSFSRAQS